MGENENKPHSPEVMTRLAKLKELKDSNAISDDDFEPATSPAKVKRVRRTIPAQKQANADELYGGQNFANVER